MNNCLYNLIIILFLLAIFNKTNGKETFAETAAVRCCKGDSDDKIEMDEKLIYVVIKIKHLKKLKNYVNGLIYLKKN